MRAVSGSGIDALLYQAERLPTLPEIPMRALALMDEPDPSLPEIGDLIAMDPVISARVVRLANSPVFGARSRVESIGTAVCRLGIREVRTLLVTISVIDALYAECEGLDLREVWRHAIGSAVIAKRLASDAGLGQPDAAYLAGLLHGIGDIFLALHFAKRFESAIATANPQRGGVGAALREEFKFSPVEICGRLLERWNIPAPVIEAVVYHDRPEEAPEQGELAEVVRAADRICRAYGIGFDYPGDPERAWLEEVPPEFLERVAKGSEPERYLETLEVVVESLAEILVALLPSPGT